MTPGAAGSSPVGGVLVMGVLLAASSSAVAATPAPAQAEPPRIVVSVSVGLVRPGDTLAGQLYGASQRSVRIDGEMNAWGSIGAFLSVRFAHADGTTAVVEPQVFEETYPIELAGRSVLAGALLTRPMGVRLRWFAGAGLAVGWHEERWPALGETVSGSSLGVAALGGIHYDLTDRFGVVGRAEISSLGARQRADDGRRPNLGGLELSLGASARF